MSKILLVDDESAITDNLTPFLKRTGFDVEVAVDGQDALGKAASFAPDLIVSDVLMPHVDGREMLRRLRQDGDWTPVILLTQVGEPLSPIRSGSAAIASADQVSISSFLARILPLRGEPGCVDLLDHSDHRRQTDRKSIVPVIHETLQAHGTVVDPFDLSHIGGKPQVRFSAIPGPTCAVSPSMACLPQTTRSTDSSLRIAMASV